MRIVNIFPCPDTSIRTRERAQAVLELRGRLPAQQWLSPIRAERRLSNVNYHHYTAVTTTLETVFYNLETSETYTASYTSRDCLATP